jgi:hypothetical protein
MRPPASGFLISPAQWLGRWLTAHSETLLAFLFGVEPLDVPTRDVIPLSLLIDEVFG